MLSKSNRDHMLLYNCKRIKTLLDKTFSVFKLVFLVSESVCQQVRGRAKHSPFGVHVLREIVLVIAEHRHGLQFRLLRRLLLRLAQTVIFLDTIKH